MWFSFPSGVSAIAVERQEFRSEGFDAFGRECFRAPDHFAPQILMLKGFAIVGEMPEGSLTDLPKEDPTRDTAIALLAKEREGLRVEVQNLRTDLTASRAQITALEGEKADLIERLKIAEKEMIDLEEEIADRPLPAGKGKVK